MDWFSYLKEQGNFIPARNPAPVPAEDGNYTIPHWDALPFLQKMAAGFKDGKHLEHIHDILTIITEVSKSPKDNYHTWYVFLKILESMPNEHVTKEVLSFIPVWLKSMFRTELQSSGICSNLLPKFLNRNSSKEDIEKAEEILKQLFVLRINENIKPGQTLGKRYESPVHLYFLKAAIIENGLKELIAVKCTNGLTSHILDQLNPALRDFIANGTFDHDGYRYTIEYLPEHNDRLLRISRSSADSGNEALLEQMIEGFLESTPEQHIQELKRILLKLGTGASLPSDLEKRLMFHFINDLFSLFGSNSFIGLDDEMSHNDDDVLSVFPLLLREILHEKCTLDPLDAKELLNRILEHKHYQLPFYKRLVLYSIASNWEVLKPLFWEMVRDKDAAHYFSLYQYRPELYYLLESVQERINEDEAQILSSIIEEGPQAEKEYSTNKEAWQHRWLDALKKNPLFDNWYRNVTASNKLEGREYKEEGKIQVFSGNISPFSMDEILSMEDSELLISLKSFRSNPDAFREPSVVGFADQLGKAVETKPERFDNVINGFIDISTSYLSRVFYGYATAWKSQRNFDWEPVLELILAIIAKLGTNRNQEGYNAELDDMARPIGHLLSQGLQQDNNAFDQVLLPLAKPGLFQLANLMPLTNRQPNSDEQDYAMYFVNTSDGQVLRALMDYSLRRARLNGDIRWSPTTVNWETDVRELLESVLNKSSKEVYILIGMYFEQFYFLDPKWVSGHVIAWANLDEGKWLAFMGGLTYGKPPGNPETYRIFVPHYQRAVRDNIGMFTKYHHGIVRHIIAFYLWDYEQVSDTSSINRQLLDHSPIETVQEYSTFLWQQERYIDKLDTEELKKMRLKVAEVWQVILNRFYVARTKDEQQLIASLFHLAEYFDSVDEKLMQLLLPSARLAEKHHNVHQLIELLVKFSKTPPATQQVKYIAVVLEAIPCKHVNEFEEEQLRELVTYLFENGEIETAKIVCNRIQLEGMGFLKETYIRYSGKS